MQGVRIQGNPTLKEGPGQLETEIEVRRLGAAESIKNVSVFHNHVVRILLCNRPAKLLWDRNKNM